MPLNNLNIRSNISNKFYPAKKLREIVFIFLLFSIGNSLFAAQYYAVASGSWTPGTATPGIFAVTNCAAGSSMQNPGPGDDIQVCIGVTLTVSGSGTINNLNLAATTSKVIISAGKILTVSGSFINNGLATNGVNGTGTIRFTGSISIGMLTPSGTAPSVIIGDGSLANTVTISANTLFSNLTINTNAALINSTFSVWIAGDFTNNGSFTSGSGIYTFTGVAKFLSGTSATTFENLDINSATSNSLSSLTVSTNLSGAGTYTQSAGSTLILNGSFTVAGLSIATEPNTVQYNGSGAQTVRSANYFNLYKSNTGTATLAGVVNIMSNGSVNISGGTLDCATFSINGTVSSTFTMSAGTQLIIGQATSATPVAFPTNFLNSNIFLDPASTVIYASNSGGQSISNVPFYGNLTIATGAASVTKPISASPLNIMGNLHLTTYGAGVVTFNPSNYTIFLTGNFTGTGNMTFTTGTFEIGGNYTNSGTFTPGTGQIKFVGTNAQLFSGPANTTFYQFRIINTSSTGLTLNNPVKITNQTFFDDGIIYTSATNILSFTSSATVPLGSSISYVDGPVVCTKATSGVSPLNFPIGKNGNFRPVVMSLTHSNATSVTYTAEVFNSSATALGYSLPGTIDRVSNVRYWDISRQVVANLTSATIRLYYDTDDGVSDYTNLAVVKDNGATSWIDLSGSATGNTTGSILSTSFASFSKFSLGNKNGGTNPLGFPVLNSPSVSSTKVCPGSSIDVTFTISGGTMNAGNIFTAELSNSTGSFASPTAIGTLTSTIAGTINATIPPATPLGGGYRIRVTSSNIALTSPDNGTDITVASTAATKYIVDVTTDTDNLLSYTPGDGTNTLRKCIRLANANCGHDTIRFNLGAGGPFTIGLTSALPNLTDNAGVTIDGWNNSGNVGTPNTIPVFNATAGTPMNANYKIILGNSTGIIPTGLVLASDSNIIKGLVLQDFGDGAVLSNSIGITISGNYNSVQGCYIGMDNSGTIKGTNTNIGIKVNGTNNFIGNGTAAGANLISGMNGSGTGILVSSGDNTFIRGNMIGLQKDGTTKVTGTAQLYGAHISGILASGGNVIGGSVSGYGNVISGNTNSGVYISSSSASGNTIQGNIIGPMADGTTNITANNQQFGITVSGSPNNIIGGNTSFQRNIISANTLYGIQVTGASSTGNIIKGNYLGLAKDGINFITSSSQDDGVFLDDVANNTIGGTGSNEGNVISGNIQNGIWISGVGATGNSVFGNIIGLQSDGLSFVVNNQQYGGINLSGSANGNIIGGITAGHRNIISGNYKAGAAVQANEGIYITGGANGNFIQGNYIGVSSDGSTAISGGLNQTYGIYFWGGGSNAGANNVIGGNGAGEGNVISGNGSSVTVGYGIYENSPIGNTTIVGNIIGPAGNGTTVVTGTNYQNFGVYIGNGSVNNTVGGSTALARNIISGNEVYGVYITGAGTSGNIIKGNYIGLNSAGTGTVTGSSQDYGVHLISSAASNIIGGTAAGEGNVISGNSNTGIRSTSSAVTGNSIFGNIIGPQYDGLSYVAGNLQIYGIQFASSPNNIIGGNTSGHKNTISANETSGVVISGVSSTGNSVQGNYIGLNSTGTTFITGSTQDFGVDISVSAASNIIGGSGSGEGNVISGNTTGIRLFSTAAGGNSVFGNIIGPQADGTSFVTGNIQNTGIFISGSQNNTIGGNTAGHRNIISSNSSQGISILGAGASGNIIKGNYIGTDVTGTAIISGASQLYGIVISQGVNNFIGGSGAGERNVISGNNSRGIYLTASASGNQIKGNYFGFGSTHAAIAGSTQQYGIYMFGGAINNSIGGSVAGEGNEIGAHTTGGIYLKDLATTGNLMSRNLIFSNTGKAIDLNYGVIQANNGNAVPVIVSATTITVSGTAGNGQTVEVFANTNGNCNDAKNFVGSTVASGAGVWSLAVSLTAGDYVLATATDGSNNTSEFSACVIVTAVANTITTSTIAPTSYCTGSTVNVAYTISGTFIAGNTFTAQLSDATGSFAAPTNIGTLVSQVAGTIIATIPAAPSGSFYRIRVVSDNPAVTGSDNAGDLAINSPDGGNGTWTWTGDQSTDWFDCRNWDKACLPDILSDVIIPGGMPNNPTITGAAANCNTISVNSSAGAVVNLNSSGGGVLNIAQ